MKKNADNAEIYKHVVIFTKCEKKWSFFRCMTIARSHRSPATGRDAHRQGVAEFSSLSMNWFSLFNFSPWCLFRATTIQPCSLDMERCGNGVFWILKARDAPRRGEISFSADPRTSRSRCHRKGRKIYYALSSSAGRTCIPTLHSARQRDLT